jgi:hypothetical protein
VNTAADEHVRERAPSAGFGEVFAVREFRPSPGVCFVQAVSPAFRGRAFGVAVSGLNGVQGLGVLIGLLAVAVPFVAFARTGDHIAVGVPLGRPSEP